MPRGRHEAVAEFIAERAKQIKKIGDVFREQTGEDIADPGNRGENSLAAVVEMESEHIENSDVEFIIETLGYKLGNPFAFCKQMQKYIGRRAGWTSGLSRTTSSTPSPSSSSSCSSTWSTRTCTSGGAPAQCAAEGGAASGPLRPPCTPSTRRPRRPSRGRSAEERELFHDPSLF
ncbi:hypothetical protein [Streptomyces sp. NBC_01615]|uniref:hypothetical protein n=1 Tax=Streptomyces sp. NBC_01615 TaxID=2975898 RepID=UPI00386FF26B